MPKFSDKSHAMVLAHKRIQKESGNVVLNSKSSNGTFTKAAGKISGKHGGK